MFISVPSFAHHGLGAIDATRDLVISGMITGVEFIKRNSRWVATASVVVASGLIPLAAAGAQSAAGGGSDVRLADAAMNRDMEAF